MSGLKDLTGKRFGRLKVLKRGKNKNSKVAWLCLCDCGNKKTVRGDLLIRGWTKSCGCLKKARLKDLTGKRFGRLKVLKRGKNKNSKVAWLCLCDCGNKKTVRAGVLTSGSSQSCGCFAREMTSKRHLKDLTGKRFGRLKVLKRGKNKNSNVAWLCLCDCGNKTTAVGSKLLQGVTKSCGCILKERYLKSKANNLKNKRFGRLLVINKEKRNRHTHMMWKCKCDCGKETIVTAQGLLCGAVKSCGCLKIDRAREIGKSDFGLRRVVVANFCVDKRLSPGDIPKDIIELQLLRIKINKEVKEYDRKY